jgi:hypothetical protein
MLFMRAFTTWLRAQPLIHAHRDHLDAKAEAAKLPQDSGSV